MKPSEGSAVNPRNSYIFPPTPWWRSNSYAGWSVEGDSLRWCVEKEFPMENSRDCQTRMLHVCCFFSYIWQFFMVNVGPVAKYTIRSVSGKWQKLFFVGETMGRSGRTRKASHAVVGKAPGVCSVGCISKDHVKKTKGLKKRTVTSRNILKNQLSCKSVFSMAGSKKHTLQCMEDSKNPTP